LRIIWLRIVVAVLLEGAGPYTTRISAIFVAANAVKKLFSIIILFLSHAVGDVEGEERKKYGDNG